MSQRSFYEAVEDAVTVTTERAVLGSTGKAKAPYLSRVLVTITQGACAQLNTAQSRAQVINTMLE